MLIPQYVKWVFPIGMMLLAADVVCGQTYPGKPVRIVTSGVGGGNDFVARLITPGLSGNLGQPVIIDNRGSGVIPGDIVSKSPPDGYTLLVIGGSLWIGSLLRKTP